MTSRISSGVILGLEAGGTSFLRMPESGFSLLPPNFPMNQASET